MNVVGTRKASRINAPNLVLYPKTRERPPKNSTAAANTIKRGMAGRFFVAIYSIVSWKNMNLLMLAPINTAAMQSLAASRINERKNLMGYSSKLIGLSVNEKHIFDKKNL
jgi:hypothetical protein